MARNVNGGFTLPVGITLALIVGFVWSLITGSLWHWIPILGAIVVTLGAAKAINSSKSKK